MIFGFILDLVELPELHQALFLPFLKIAIFYGILKFLKNCSICSKYSGETQETFSRDTKSNLICDFSPLHLKYPHFPIKYHLHFAFLTLFYQKEVTSTKSNLLMQISFCWCRVHQHNHFDIWSLGHLRRSLRHTEVFRKLKIDGQHQKKALLSYNLSWEHKTCPAVNFQAFLPLAVPQKWDVTQ